jgi:hypothetical protein
MGWEFTVPARMKGGEDGGYGGRRRPRGRKSRWEGREIRGTKQGPVCKFLGVL